MIWVYLMNTNTKFEANPCNGFGEGENFEIT